LSAPLFYYIVAHPAMIFFTIALDLSIL